MCQLPALTDNERLGRSVFSRRLSKRNQNSELTYNIPQKKPYEKSCLNITHRIFTPAMKLPATVPVIFEAPTLFL